MTNVYLEKIALNAFKARGMAKEVGIIPDPDSAWRFALRRLRDSQGKPLQGKQLAKGRINLGDLSNNGYQKVKAYSGKLASNTEAGGVVDRATGDVSRLSTGEVRSGTGPYVDDGNMHTHPYGQEVTSGHAGKVSGNQDQAYRAGQPHRIAAPSGLKHTVDSNTVYRDTFGGNRGRAWDAYQSGSTAGKSAVDWRVPGDVSTFSNHTFDKIAPSGHRESIVAPKVDTVSSTRIKQTWHSPTYGGKRSSPITIYFDHTPRKAR